MYKMQSIVRVLQLKIIAFGACAVMLTACDGNQVTLVAEVNQTAANSIVLILGNNNIEARKEPHKGGTYDIMVSTKNQVVALNLLKANGQPEEKFATMGEVFVKDSFISSPLEEHGRFLHALDQEIMDMLSSINGVTEVKTAVSLPLPTDNLWAGETPKPSASVFIKYRQGEPLNLYVNKIKNLVSNAVPGLTPDRVEVFTVVQKDS
jgi:type III secretion protein J